jgi:hypothetical protein
VEKILLFLVMNVRSGHVVEPNATVIRTAYF